MKKQGLFIVGTDTDVGKTFITALIGGLLQSTNYSIGLLKPIASGAKKDENGHLYSEDGRELMRLSHIPIEKENLINPIRIPGEYSPKIAAQKVGMNIDLDNLKKIITDTINTHDFTLIEGAGGITTPLTEKVRLDQYMQEFSYPILLICDGRLGSINRALLTANYIKGMGKTLIGIIINNQDKTNSFLLETNKKDIELYTQVPILGTVPKYEGTNEVQNQLDWAKNYINIDSILNAWEKTNEK